MPHFSFLACSLTGWILFTGAWPVFASSDDQQIFTSGHARTALLELYTSEGCSSCPPAEAWLSRFTSSPKLWSELVPVSFHVDYWDRLGWRDRFASHAATVRQSAYALAWHSSSVYTPGFVLNGREWTQWSSVPAGTWPSSTDHPADAGLLSVTVSAGKTVTVHYQPDARPTLPREVTVALLGFDLNSKVKAGENQGRSLEHDFVVLATETKRLSPTNAPATPVFELPGADVETNRLALSVWVQGPDNGPIEQATGGWLHVSAQKPK